MYVKYPGILFCFFFHLGILYSGTQPVLLVRTNDGFEVSILDLSSDDISIKSASVQVTKNLCAYQGGTDALNLIQRGTDKEYIYQLDNHPVGFVIRRVIVPDSKHIIDAKISNNGNYIALIQAAFQGSSYKLIILRWGENKPFFVHNIGDGIRGFSFSEDSGVVIFWEQDIQHLQYHLYIFDLNTKKQSGPFIVPSEMDYSNVLCGMNIRCNSVDSGVWICADRLKRSLFYQISKGNLSSISESKFFGSTTDIILGLDGIYKWEGRRKRIIGYDQWLQPGELVIASALSLDKRFVAIITNNALYVIDIVLEKRMKINDKIVTDSVFWIST